MSANLSGTTKTNTITPVDDNTVGVIPLSARKALRTMIDDMEPDSIVFETLDNIRLALRNGADAVTGTVTNLVSVLGNAIYHSTPATRATGQAGPLEADASGNLRTAEQYVTGYSYARMTTAATLLVKTGAGVLHAIIVNTPVANGTIELDDALTNTTPIIGKVTLPAALVNEGPQTAIYDVAFTTGLSITTTGTMDITIVYL